MQRYLKSLGQDTKDVPDLAAWLEGEQFRAESRERAERLRGTAVDAETEPNLQTPPEQGAPPASPVAPGVTEATPAVSTVVPGKDAPESRGEAQVQGQYVFPGTEQAVAEQMNREQDVGRYEDPNVWMRHCYDISLVADPVASRHSP